MTSSSESSDVEDEEVINTNLISFISKKKKFILSLVSDPLSKYHARSDRLSALQRLSLIRRFEKNAEREMRIIRLEMREIFWGKVFNVCELYISHIFEDILQESRPSNPDDIEDCGGSFLVPLKIKIFIQSLKPSNFQKFSPNISWRRKT